MAEKDGVLRTMKDQAFAENPMDREAVGEDTKVESLKGQFEIYNSLKENGFDNLLTFRFVYRKIGLCILNIWNCLEFQ